MLYDLQSLARICLLCPFCRHPAENFWAGILVGIKICILRFVTYSYCTPLQEVERHDHGEANGQLKTLHSGS